MPADDREHKAVIKALEEAADEVAAALKKNPRIANHEVGKILSLAIRKAYRAGYQDGFLTNREPYQTGYQSGYDDGYRAAKHSN